MDAERFIYADELNCDDVDDILLNKQKIERNENRKRLVLIVKTIILRGQNNISLQGYRDDGDLSMESVVCSESKLMTYCF